MCSLHSELQTSSMISVFFAALWTSTLAIHALQTLLSLLVCSFDTLLIQGFFWSHWSCKSGRLRVCLYLKVVGWLLFILKILGHSWRAEFQRRHTICKGSVGTMFNASVSEDWDFLMVGSSNAASFSSLSVHLICSYTWTMTMTG